MEKVTTKRSDAGARHGALLPLNLTAITHHNIPQQNKGAISSPRDANAMGSAQALADIRATPSRSRSSLAPERSFQSPHSLAADKASQRGTLYSNASNQSHEVLMMCRRANSAVEAAATNTATKPIASRLSPAP